MTNTRETRSARDKAAALRAAAAAAEQHRRRTMLTAAVLATVAALAAIGVIVKVGQDGRRTQDAAFLQAPKGVVNGGLPFGPADAKVTVDVWADFLCPACRQFEQANDQQLQAFVKDGTARVVYHPLGWLDSASTTGYSTRAAIAAGAVFESAPTAWPAFATSLYADQPAEGSEGLPDSRLVELAVSAGAPAAPVQGALQSRRFAGWVGQMTDTFSKKGYRGTPSVEVNGKLLTFVDGSSTTDQLKAAVAAAGKG